jgi:very-short-patch-repair endonuclease
MSPPEVLLWSQLRGSKLGFKVRRQHPIGPYIADFFVPQEKLVIEVDGGAHDFGDRPELDAARDRYLNERGYQVVRILAVEVMKNLEGALQFIAEHVQSPLHHPPDGPPPHSGEDC